MLEPLLSEILEFGVCRKENVNATEKELFIVQMIEHELFHHNYFEVERYLLEIEAPPELIATLWNYISRVKPTEFIPPSSISKKSPVDTLSAIEFLSGIPEEAIEMRGAVLLIDLSVCPKDILEVVKEVIPIPTHHLCDEDRETREDLSSPFLPGIAEFLVEDGSITEERVKEGESIRTR